jgi:nucleotide-binding universal stress UspA family protein/uncharacterized protein (DUF697 family)/tellurite resistance protein
MKVLVAVDISPNTVQICEFLQKYLKPSEHPEVTILHVYEPELDYSEDHPLKHGVIRPTSEAKLQQIFQPLANTCTLRYEITDEGLGDCILSRTAQVDLVVMGRRRRTQMQEMVTGSLSQFVLHRAACPVLIVPESKSHDDQPPLAQPSKPAISPEAIARLKVLICVAKADGTLDRQEKLQLESIVQQSQLPDHLTLEQLTTEPIDLAQELAQIIAIEEQETTYYAAYLLANLSTEYASEEHTIIRQIISTFNLSSERVRQLKALVDQSCNVQGAGKVQFIEDATQRSQVVEQKIRRYAAATAILGAFPSPLLSSYTQSAALGLQTTLMAEIAGVWGHSGFQVKPLFTKMVGSLGLVSAWLMALDIAKLVPKIGSNIGAIDAFTATWAMGKAAQSYFESKQAGNGKELKSVALRQVFKQARKAGEVAYFYSEPAIAEQQQLHAAQIRLLTNQLKTGKLTSAHYQQCIQQLLVVVQQPFL